jgi:hypothetical protein
VIQVEGLSNKYEALSSNSSTAKKKKKEKKPGTLWRFKPVIFRRHGSGRSRFKASLVKTVHKTPSPKAGLTDICLSSQQWQKMQNRGIRD